MFAKYFSHLHTNCEFNAFIFMHDNNSFRSSSRQIVNSSMNKSTHFQSLNEILVKSTKQLQHEFFIEFNKFIQLKRLYIHHWNILAYWSEMFECYSKVNDTLLLYRKMKMIFEWLFKSHEQSVNFQLNNFVSFNEFCLDELDTFYIAHEFH